MSHDETRNTSRKNDRLWIRIRATSVRLIDGMPAKAVAGAASTTNDPAAAARTIGDIANSFRGRVGGSLRSNRSRQPLQGARRLLQPPLCSPHERRSMMNVRPRLLLAATLA